MFFLSLLLFIMFILILIFFTYYDDDGDHSKIIVIMMVMVQISKSQERTRESPLHDLECPDGIHPFSSNAETSMSHKLLTAKLRTKRN